MAAQVLREVRRLLPEVGLVITRLALIVRRPDSVTLTGVRLDLNDWATEPIRNRIYRGWFE